MNKSPSEEFTFRKQDSIGVNDAEDDKKYLLNCFIDTGDYEIIEDLSDSRCLILGRTGMGKTALLTKLKENKDGKNVVITINPESLAMQHITNSPIIRQLFELDINLNTFFKLLWRHVVCVEIFTHHFKAMTRSEHDDVIERLRNILKKENPKHSRALNYLEEWKDTFWKEDNSHVVEMLSRTETELGGALKAASMGVRADLSAKKKLTEEEKHVMRQRAQTIVDQVQMKEVSNLIEMLNEVIEHQQKQYYIIIDKLDEGWVDDILRYQLIKALIETVRDVNHFKNLKPLVVLRADLLNHVFQVTQDTGFQEEKYSSLYMHVSWTRRELTALLDERVNYSFKSRYRKKHEVDHKDLLPEKIMGENAIDYILDRTLMRPRDAIDFFNICIREATESPIITEQMVLDAERIYSRDRLDSIYYEWFIDFPKLKEWTYIIRDRERDFFAGGIDLAALEEKALKYAVDNNKALNDRFYQISEELTDGKMNVVAFRNHVVYIFYMAGLLGLHVDGYRTPIWSYDLKKKISVDDINDSTLLYVHPCFRSALNIK
jgi:hypothetical protein